MTDSVCYSGKYFKGTREDLLTKVAAQMGEKRFNHVLRVEQTALELAEKNQENSEKASIAALCHDYAKERPNSEMIQLIEEQNLGSDLVSYGSGIWHSATGAYLAQHELGITDSDILAAIQQHTVGAVEMSTLAKIIFVADYIEPGRNFPEVEEARIIANADLDEGVFYEVKQTLSYLLENQRKIYPQALVTYNAIIEKKEIH